MGYPTFHNKHFNNTRAGLRLKNRGFIPSLSNDILSNASSSKIFVKCSVSSKFKNVDVDYQALGTRLVDHILRV